MTGKLIIFAILAMVIWAGYTKIAQKFGLSKRPAPVHKAPKPLLTKFNLIMAGLIGLYILWGATQIFS